VIDPGILIMCHFLQPKKYTGGTVGSCSRATTKEEGTRQLSKGGNSSAGRCSAGIKGGMRWRR